MTRGRPAFPSVAGTQIPKRLHRVWLGPPMPEQLRAYGETWTEQHPDWDHRLWTEEDLPALQNQRLFDQAEQIAPDHVGQLRADIVRYELLAHLGGVYVDADLECQRPLDALLEGVECFAAWESARWINNAILGARPAHPFMQALIDGLPHNVRRRRGARPNKLSGPQYLTRVYRQFPGEVTVFPRELFYPYSWDELERGEESFPDAVAVHHWQNQRRESA